mgnify:FL=1
MFFYDACMDATRHLLVYTAPGCCLCDEARVELDALAPQLDMTVSWIDISGDPELEAEWRTQIPAGVLNGRKVFKYRVDAQLLERRLHTPTD